MNNDLPAGAVGFAVRRRLPSRKDTMKSLVSRKESGSIKGSSMGLARTQIWESGKKKSQ